MTDKPLSDALLDLALEQSFPASDPPSFMAGAAIVGAPRRPHHREVGAPETQAGEPPGSVKVESRRAERRKGKAARQTARRGASRRGRTNAI